jgi:hypothetical protein
MAIHRQRGGGYWYYWLIVLGGTVFAIAYFASDGFGLGR